MSHRTSLFRQALGVTFRTIAILPLSVMAVVEGREQWEARAWDPSWIPEEKLNTGDVVIFSQPWYTFLTTNPRHALSVFGVKAFQKTAWDHVGIVVVSGGVPHVVEAAPEGGARMVPYSDRVRSAKARAVAVRRLNVQRTPESLARLGRYVDSVLRSASPTVSAYGSIFWLAYDTKEERAYFEILRDITAGESFIKEVRSRRFYLEEDVMPAEARLARAKACFRTISPHVEGTWSQQPSRQEDIPPTCSELVAACLQCLGVLPEPFPPARKYIPLDFVGQTLPFLHGTSLSDLVVVQR